MIFGISTTENAVVVAETTGKGDTFSISRITSVPILARSGEDLAELLRCLARILGRRRRGAGTLVALLGSSSGRYKASLVAIKAEAITELAAFQTGLRVVKVSASRLKTSLGCARDQKWQDRATQLFDPHDERAGWSRGVAGAASAAFTVAADARPRSATQP